MKYSCQNIKSVLFHTSTSKYQYKGNSGQKSMLNPTTEMQMENSKIGKLYGKVYLPFSTKIARKYKKERRESVN